jgi:para-nitrobenzyl esterase
MKTSQIIRIVTAVVAVGCASASTAASKGEIVAKLEQTIVSTDKGPVQGVMRTTTTTFFGIPFAAPPLGSLRWKPPQPAAAWTTTLDATKFRAHCLQEGSPGDPNASEDCLYLNVYAPRGNATGLPVMVWIYGGANAVGASDFYDPTPLVETGGVVVVTINYRVGALGFLAHPALDAEGHPAVNYGIMDQQLALHWVQSNIAGFSGDPTNVTIFGESAGGLDTSTHLASPLSAGLFQKAIIESGAYTLNTPSLAASEARGIAFANGIGCTDQTAACLRSKSALDVLANEGTVNSASAAYNQSTVDGQILTETQISAFTSGRINRVPVIQGANSHEGRAFLPTNLDVAGYQATVAGFALAVGKTAAQGLAEYPLTDYANPFEAASAALGDFAFACSARTADHALEQWVVVHAYEFGDEAAGPLGAAHGAEVQYLFNVTQAGAAGGPASLPPQSQQLALAMRQYWTNFARSSDPNGPGLPYWKRYFGLLDSYNLLIPPVPGIDLTFGYATRHKCAFWS